MTAARQPRLSRAQRWVLQHMGATQRPLEMRRGSVWSDEEADPGRYWPNWYARGTTIGSLVNAGLLDYFGPYGHSVRLTPLGAQVAHHLWHGTRGPDTKP